MSGQVIDLNMAAHIARIRCACEWCRAGDVAVERAISDANGNIIHRHFVHVPDDGCPASVEWLRAREDGHDVEALAREMAEGRTT